ncbi:MAG: UDP-3-O-(3-hydroxymyristoyl)glucosamine N-acyltransferase [Pyrinomonadaceae bacterium]|nr:UDP-3-O-(3-hydroxymyristoyl)glucosamine N-acyltransferase [Pyrinomonadaceae bacterium]
MSREAEGVKVSELARVVGGHVAGDGEVVIRRVADLESATEGAVAFVEDAKVISLALKSKASCLIVPEGEAIAGKSCIEARQPKLAFALVAEVLHPPKRKESFVDLTAVVRESANVHASAFVGAHAHIGLRSEIKAEAQIHHNVFIGDDVSIGRRCVIHPNVTIYDGVRLGERVILHAGVVIGADGFGYVRDVTGAYHKFPQVGTVEIGDDVEIGANTCIDRAALGLTRIGRGTKIDNLVQIGHNVLIGECVVIAAQTGISGSTVIEDDCVIGGQVGMGDHARVERGAIVGSKAGILPGKIVRAGQVMWGVPVRPLDEYKRLNAHFGRLPQMHKELQELRRRVAELTAQVGGSNEKDS